MSKVYGLKSSYSLIREDRSRHIASYGMEEVDGVYATWHEVYFYKKMEGKPSFAQVKKAILADIDARTDEKIQNGFVWTPAAGGDPIPVCLDAENKFNFKSAYDLAVQKNGATLPVTFKMNQDEDGSNPVYHTFETMEDADDFYLHAVAYIHQTYAAGWAEKDGIDWEPYKALFPEPEVEPSE